MILIQRIKKIKRAGWFSGVLFDIVFYTIFFALGASFVLSKTQDNNEKLLILEQKYKGEPSKIEMEDSTLENDPKYVASSRGKYFYEIGSAKANSLSDKNKIYFSSQDEAKNLGFKPYFAN